MLNYNDNCTASGRIISWSTARSTRTPCGRLPAWSWRRTRCCWRSPIEWAPTTRRVGRTVLVELTMAVREYPRWLQDRFIANSHLCHMQAKISERLADLKRLIGVDTKVEGLARVDTEAPMSTLQVISHILYAKLDNQLLVQWKNAEIIEIWAYGLLMSSSLKNIAMNLKRESINERFL